jgi:transcriptional regulator GlxA family with amidase domain
VINYINENLSKKITRDELVKISGMPVATFYKIFKQATGLSPIEYIIRLRISFAAELLSENHNMSITDVALETGFDDSAYFSKKFKEIMGSPPITYQRNHRMIIDQIES